MLPEGIIGLTAEEVKINLQKFGLNVLPEKRPPTQIEIFVSQLKSPLVFVLLFAGIITFLIGHIPDTIIILLAVFLNTILGFVEERKASHALLELKKLITTKAKVVREGKTETINTQDIVPGDIIVLQEGAKIPADGIILSANRLFVNEAILTGESIALPKAKDAKVAMGTIVTSGQGFFKVVSTGIHTSLGEIAQKVQEKEEITPLKKQLVGLSKTLTLIVVALTTFVFVIGTLRGADILEMFVTSVSLAVSAIPEGLLVGLTVVLAIGMRKILKRKGLVRNLVSAETLGGVSVICVDKTGTITKGEMTVVEQLGEKEALIKQCLVANDLDDPIVVAAYHWAKNAQSDHDQIIAGSKRIDSLPFSSEERFFASLNKEGNKEILYVNGAPDFLLNWTTLDETEKQKVKEQIERLTKQGKRIVGFAKKEFIVNGREDITIKPDDIKTNLEWVGILAFSDPVRESVAEAFQETQKAGIRTIVITGDYADTAKNILKEIGMVILDHEIMFGEELARLDEQTLATKIKDIKLFARTTPLQKLKIVDCLKANGEVVAMMGDGVNDAPALIRADIGIAVESATDVSRESADLILLDSNFSTIVAAVKEGRVIFANLRKIILYLLSDAFSEITAVIITILVGLPTPVTAVQILWINLVSDGFPNLALTVDPPDANIMTMSPRSSREKLMTSWMKSLIAIVSITSGIMAFGLFYLVFKKTNDLTLARSVAFLSLGTNSLVYVFSIKNLTTPFWQDHTFGNRWLNIAVIAGFILQGIPYAFEVTRAFFKVVIPPIDYLILVCISAMILFAIIEITKVSIRHQRTR